MDQNQLEGRYETISTDENFSSWQKAVPGTCFRISVMRNPDSTKVPHRAHVSRAAQIWHHQQHSILARPPSDFPAWPAWSPFMSLLDGGTCQQGQESQVLWGCDKGLPAPRSEQSVFAAPCKEPSCCSGALCMCTAAVWGVTTALHWTLGRENSVYGWAQHIQIHQGQNLFNDSANKG